MKLNLNFFRFKYPNNQKLSYRISLSFYSVFYVFYDQYLTIWRDLIVNLTLSFTAVFIVTCLLLGFDFHTSFLIILCVFMIITHMFGVMYLWHIELNAISAVNIIMVSFKNIRTKIFILFLLIVFSRLVLQLNFVLILLVILLLLKAIID